MFKSSVSLGFIYAVSCASALIPRGSYDSVERRSPPANDSKIWAAFYCEGPNYRGDCVTQQYSGGECTQVLPAYSSKILSFLTSSSNCILYQGSDCTGSAVPIYSSVQDLRAFTKTNSYRCGLTSGLVATRVASVPSVPTPLPVSPHVAR
ncbi:hypothetical protein BDN71DRAFT_409604 [Pleurotus eryngii]|uniref:Uncharacterized protein n=1 Tax=Pleurotus eryngii TaxID=5323 RepID=A0A9P6D2N6_PLEER|nr:hypothetical protein BDN71DRAFT_409604 [Pleurotus eryngii]